MSKLDKGVTGYLLKTISSFLHQRLIRLQYKNIVSTYRQTKQGLPQGSVLSPFLFNIMIDDITELTETIPGTNALLYADDLIIWATSSDFKGLEKHMQQVLKLLEKLANEN